MRTNYGGNAMRKITIATIAMLMFGSAVQGADQVRFTFVEPNPNKGTFGVAVIMEIDGREVPRSTACIECKSCKDNLKAKAIASALNAVKEDETNNQEMYDAEPVALTCQVLVKAKNGYDIAYHGWIVCKNCNQENKSLDDPRKINSYRQAVFGLDGVMGTDSLASVTVGFTTVDEPSETLGFSLPTVGRSPSALLDQITDSLTAMGISAARNGNAVIAQNLGYFLRYGTSDTSLADFGGGSFAADIPTLTEWGLIIFGVVLLGVITWVFLKRRKVVGVGA
jgi:hypothetical protein